MNNIEKQMISVLKELKNDYGVFEIKAEFESEGSRMEELMRLKDVTSSVGIPIILKFRDWDLRFLQIEPPINPKPITAMFMINILG